MDINWLIQEFGQLDIVQQKKKLVQMAEQIKDADPVFLELYELVTTREDLQSEFITWLYQDILELGQAIQTYDKEQQIKKVGDLQQKLQILREKEEKERILEQQEAEAMINTI